MILFYFFVIVALILTDLVYIVLTNLNLFVNRNSVYSRVRNKHRGTLINFWGFFPGATSLLKGATFIEFWFLKNFLRIFNFLFLWLCIKESNYLLFERRLHLFRGLCLLILPNVPGAMFIQGGTFIPDSRVQWSRNSFANMHFSSCCIK